MVEEKLKILEETLYEIFASKIDECEVSPVTACLILKNIESKIQDEAIAELALRILKMEQQNNTQNEIKEEI